MNNSFAPILIPTLNRYTHLKRCIDSLILNTNAEQTILYIALDFPAKSGHYEGYNQIINYIPTIKGFKEVIIIKREKNYGAGINFFNALDLVFQKHDRVIYTEDDNELSPNFLEYINKSLDYYEKDSDVLAVCGYLKPGVYPDTDNTCIQLNLFDAWGGGFWKDKYYKFKPDLEFSKVTHYLNDTKIVLRLINKRIFTLWYLLIIQYGKDKFIWDTMISAKCFIEDKKCVFPIISKSKNGGMDGSGAHHTIDDGFYSKQVIDSESNFAVKEEKEKSIIKRFHKTWFLYHRLSKRKIWWTITRYIAYIIKIKR